MALEASSPPVQELNRMQQARADQLQDEIANARAEAESLTKRASVLAGALLASSTVQSQLSDHLDSSIDVDLKRILDNRQQYTITSVHRLAFGVTTFAFVDISAENPGRHLLGIRFDIHRRGGATEAPYYILCKNPDQKTGRVGIYQHTLPAHIPLTRYQNHYLGTPDEGYPTESADSSEQNLEGLVQRVRTDLVAWRLRQDTIRAVQDELNVSAKEGDSRPATSWQTVSTHGIASFDAVAEDASYARIVWLNGRVGRLKIGKSLKIEQAVVFGKIDGEEQRCPDYEAALLGGDGHLETVVGRLQVLGKVD